MLLNWCGVYWLSFMLSVQTVNMHDTIPNGVELRPTFCADYEVVHSATSTRVQFHPLA